MAALFSGWELTTTIVVALLLVVIVIFSVLRPSSRIRLGVFIEREILHKEEPTENEAPTEEWPRRKEGE